MNWEIFLGIAALVGFMASVIGPIIKLTNTITTLSGAIDNLDKSVKDQKDGLEKLEQRLHDLEVKK